MCMHAAACCAVRRCEWSVVKEEPSASQRPRKGRSRHEGWQRIAHTRVGGSGSSSTFRVRVGVRVRG